MECKKDWYLNNVIIFEKGWHYPIKDHHMDGDKNIQAFQISSGSLDDEDSLLIWFWSGSDYFEIEYLNIL